MLRGKRHTFYQLVTSLINFFLLISTEICAKGLKGLPNSLVRSPCNSTNSRTDSIANVTSDGTNGNWLRDSRTCTISPTVNEEDEGAATRYSAMTIDSIGAVCNTLLIITILVNPLNLLRKGAWCTILNLAVADFIESISHFMSVGLSVEFNVPMDIARKPFIVFQFFWMFGSSASFLLLTLLTIETYLIVKYPIRSRLTLRSSRIALCCFSVWIVATLMGLMNTNYALHDFTLAQSMKMYIGMISVLELTVLIQVILKILIVHEVLKSRRNTEVSTKQQNTKRKEMAKTVVALNVILIVTAFPYFIAKQLEHIWKLGVFRGADSNSLLWRFSNYYEPIAVINFAANPILYSLRLSDYRQSLLALFCRDKRSFSPSRTMTTIRTAVSRRSHSSFRTTVDNTRTTKV